MVVLLTLVFIFINISAPVWQQTDRPNILWLTTEDHGPHLGAYGDDYAHTPGIDSFAEKSFRYDIAWSDAPVCAPARTAIITGVYPTSMGAEHMRSDVKLPEFIRKYPALLRDAGYYTTNNSKTDYNVTGYEDVWDESSPQAHYRNRQEGQPFFAVFNFMESHESRIRNRTELPFHDPDEAPVPPYHPDTPEVRRDWAEYYNSIYEADKRVQAILDELEENGLADDTIIFFYADHGSGMPGHKRWPNNRGLHVPLIVHVPEKYLHLAPQDYVAGGFTRRPVAFVDLAPTLLSIIGIKPPDWMQGRAFMGHYESKPREYLFGFRGRMDERYDMIRSVRNDRYVYIRNYMPHLIYGQYIEYMWITETTGVWEKMYQKSMLNQTQSYFWQPKPEEELYDLFSDPHEIDNLANRNEYRHTLHELRSALNKHLLETRDTGFLHEAELHLRAKEHDLTIYELASDNEIYPIERIIEFAETAASRNMGTMPYIMNGLKDPDAAIRYWSVLGVLIRGERAYEVTSDLIKSVLYDENPIVRIAAAKTLVEFGSEADIRNALAVLLDLAPADKVNAFASIAVLNILSEMDEAYHDQILPIIQNMEVIDHTLPNRPNDYVFRIVESILGKHD
ncbi:MAG: sulfatase [Balneolaceae bacterium]|nr:MAG: sulfatase [Balneolaceae bacterium]